MKQGITYCFAICLLLCLPSPSISARLETRFGPILYDTDEQLVDYVRCLHPYVPPVLNYSKPSQDEIVARHEYIFETICDKLDIKLNGLKTSVRIVSSLEKLRAEYRRLVPGSTKKVSAFYSKRHKTIWYALENLNHDIALHETAHAVLDHYFIRTIPAGVDEIVAEKVERFN